MAQVPEAPEPAGFGNCAVCAYRLTGSAEICSSCASATMEPLPRAHRRCMICDRKLPDDAHCKNPLCTKPVADRGWDLIFAISMRSGVLKRAIELYKYQDKTGWALIFGRVLVGYLEQLPLFRQYDLIIPMPTYVGTGGRDRDHIAEIVERAAVEDPSWPFRTDVMAKTKPTPRLAEVKGGFSARAHVAETQIGPALELRDPASVAGAHVLVFDDVFTAGLTLREVALKLRAAGASAVAGVVLARQPYTGRR
jgi:predicted amidophosphoribosyltransferase